MTQHEVYRRAADDAETLDVARTTFSTMTGMEVIGHGIDLVEISRIRELLSRHGRKFSERCFTDAEKAYADSGRRRRVERYAVRFACKEAVMKAIGTGWREGISWRDIEVVRLPSGAPIVQLGGRCAEIAGELGITRWHVSLSHTESLAIASVIGSG